MSDVPKRGAFKVHVDTEKREAIVKTWDIPIKRIFSACSNAERNAGRVGVSSYTLLIHLDGKPPTIIGTLSVKTFRSV